MAAFRVHPSVFGCKTDRQRHAVTCSCSSCCSCRLIKFRRKCRFVLTSLNRRCSGFGCWSAVDGRAGAVKGKCCGRRVEAETARRSLRGLLDGALCLLDSRCARISHAGHMTVYCEFVAISRGLPGLQYPFWADPYKSLQPPTQLSDDPGNRNLGPDVARRGRCGAPYATALPPTAPRETCKTSSKSCPLLGCGPYLWQQIYSTPPPPMRAHQTRRRTPSRPQTPCIPHQRAHAHE